MRRGTEARVIVPVELLTMSYAMSGAEHRNPDVRNSVDARVTRALEIAIEGRGLTALDPVHVVGTTSWFVHLERRPAPRRWRDRLLLRHPMTTVESRKPLDGWHEGASTYDVHYAQHVVDVPPEVGARLRTYPPGAYGIPKHIDYFRSSS